MGTLTVHCEGGPADGDVVEVPADRLNMPPQFIRRSVMAFDESTETVWWVGVRYARHALYTIPRPGYRWTYYHCPPTRTPGATPGRSTSR